MVPEAILWDFDGVILDSMPIRTDGFRKIFKGFPPDKVEELIIYHVSNGGLSRYVKIRYFFENLLGEAIIAEDVLKYADMFSEIMLKLLQNKALLIKDSVAFIERYHSKIPFHIVSGSDGTELNILCKALDIDQYFLSIEGSPTPKKQLVKGVLDQYSYIPSKVVLVGDSKNDFEAAVANNIKFWGYNNIALKELRHDSAPAYLASFKDIAI